MDRSNARAERSNLIARGNATNLVVPCCATSGTRALLAPPPSMVGDAAPGRELRSRSNNSPAQGAMTRDRAKSRSFTDRSLPKTPNVDKSSFSSDQSRSKLRWHLGSTLLHSLSLKPSSEPSTWTPRK